MSIRFISRSRQSMQRLGFCKAVLAFSDLANTGSQMSQIIQTKLETHKFPVEYDKDLISWLKIDEQAINSKSTVQASLQNLYIFRHPSQAGRLSKLAVNEYVEFFPRGLGLVTNSYKPTDMGVVLSRGIMTKNDYAAFTHPSEHNPLILEPSEQAFFLYNILWADGDFMLPFCKTLINAFGDNNFNYLDAGLLVPGVIENMLERFGSSVYTSTDRAQIQTLHRARNKIIQNIEEKAEEKGSGSRREQTTVPRLEWLLDLGALEKSGPRTWAFTESGLKLISLAQDYDVAMETHYPDNVIKHILDSRFFGFLCDYFGVLKNEDTTSEDFMDFIRPAYKSTISAGGYSLFRPLLLLSTIMSIVSKRRGVFYEYEEAVRILEETFQSDPSKLQYTIDRFNTDYQIKMYSSH
ncbi:hypothetical protein ACFLT4_00895 [Chloroflexota bacterium]